MFLTVFEAFRKAFRTDMTDLCRENIQKKVIFIFFRFFDVGNLLYKRFWTRIRFSDRRADKIQAKNNIWCPSDLFWPFLGLFDGPSGQTSENRNKNMKKGWKKPKKSLILFLYRCRNTFYEVYTSFGHAFRLFDPLFCFFVFFFYIYI